MTTNQQFCVKMECKADHSPKKRIESAIKILNKDLAKVPCVYEPLLQKADRTEDQ